MQEQTRNLWRVGYRIRKMLAGKSKPPDCSHLDQIREVSPGTDGCEECLKIGDTWVHLRMCLTCGKVGCCDNSKNRHATKHSHQSGHPLIRSLEPGEDWAWCYLDEVMFNPEEAGKRGDR